MNFQFPWFLLALISLVIPILLHLYNNRRHQLISFSHLFFFDKKEIHSKKPSKIKKKILLSLRILALISIVLAFALPFMHSKEETVSSTPIIFLDQSPSMNVQVGENTLFKQIKLEVMNTLNQMQEQDQVVMISTMFPRSYQLFNKKEAIQWTKSLEISSQFLTPLQLQLAIEQTEQELSIKNAPVYIFSNFQQSVWQRDTLSWEQDRLLHLIPAAFETSQNYYIDSAWVESVSQERTLSFNVKGLQMEEDSVKVALYINDQLYQTEQWDVNQSTTAQYILPDIHKSTHFTLIVEDPRVPFDDTLRMIYIPDQWTPISLITSNNIHRFFNALSQSAPTLQLDLIHINDLNSDHKTLDFIVYEAEADVSLKDQEVLKSFVQEGGTVFWMPSYELQADHLLSILSTWLPTQSVIKEVNENYVQRLDQQHPIFREIIDWKQAVTSLPKVFQYFKWQFQSNVVIRPMMYLADGSPFIYEYHLGKGKVYFLTASLDPRASNLGQHYLFAPLIYTLVLQNQSTWPLYLSNSDNYELFIMDATSATAPWHIKNTVTDMIPAQFNYRNGKKINIPAYYLSTGVYQLMKPSYIDTFEFAYNLSSDFSILKSLNSDHLQALLTQGSQAKIYEKGFISDRNGFSEPSPSSNLWKFLLVFGLFCLMMDIWMTYRDST